MRANILNKPILIILLICIAALVLPSVSSSQTMKALFDNTKNETVGNADWIIDTQQPIPSPAQSGITPATPETYWLGAISAWGVDLVKLGFTVHTLTSSYGITYGNSGNPYDLSNYNLFIVCEPQNPFTTTEKSAIRQFVQNGGGLMMVADHNSSDRDGDGWDSPEVWNDLRSDSLFGIHFQSNGESNNSITQVATNLSTDPTDSIIHSAAGTVTALSYHAGTTMRLLTSANPTAQGHVWMNGTPKGTTQIMTATARYGIGKVAGVGDSSPADDSTGQPGNTLYNGWTEIGATDNILFLNLSLWLVSQSTPPAPPQVQLLLPNDSATAVSIPTTFRWYRAQGATRYQFDLSTSDAFSSYVVTDSTISDTSITVASLSLNTTYYWRVRATDGIQWGEYSNTRTFTTWNVPSAVELDDPVDHSTDVPIPTTFRWHPTLNAAVYHLQVSTSPDFSVLDTNDSTLTDTARASGNVALGSVYYWRVRAGNAAGWGVFSSAYQLTTWDVPAQVHLVSPPNSGNGLPDTITFRWTPVPGTLWYQFELSNVQSFETFIVQDSLLTDTTLSQSGFDSVSTYFWRVRARNGAGNGSYSDVFSFTPAAIESVRAGVRRGWNIISVPMQLTDTRKGFLFPKSISRSYAYNGVYVSAETLLSGVGYWLKFDSSRTIMLAGIPRTEDTIEVSEGWNLIGTLSAPISSSSVESHPPSLVASDFYEYTGRYAVADTLLPMRGYWINVKTNGQLILRSNKTETSIQLGH